MMFISTTEYFGKIRDALENVIAPEIEDDFVRGQLYAAVFLIDQMIDRIDYRPDLVMEAIRMACETTRKIVGALEEKVGSAPDELKTFLGKIDRNDYGKTLAFCIECEEILGTAIDFFYVNRGKLGQTLRDEIDRLIVDYFNKVALRNLGMMKTSTSGKLLQSRSQP